MAENASQNESIALYRYMCENIVGSEEHVKQIRLMNNIRDNLQTNIQCIPITSGSFGEGLDMEGSDLDIMMVMKGTEVCENANIRFEHKTTYFEMQTEYTQPGYTQLRLVYTNDQKFFKDCEKIGYDYYYSNMPLKRNYTIPLLETVHGPCISDDHGIIDLAYCIHSKSWIKPAISWITRSNNSWPMSNVKHSILKHGVLFVPVGVKGSSKEELEWRISFSVGEKLLVFTFTHTQLICYALMKILLKDIISSDLNVSDLLCSYFMKTIMFWISEELSTTIWKPENLISCFIRCFRRLIYYVKYSVCPHYFIPSNNLFENKMNEQVKEILLNTLLILNSYSWQCILFSERISKFDILVHVYGIKKEPHFLYVRSIEAFLSSMIDFADDSLCQKTFSFERGIHKVLSTKSSKIRSFYTYYISKLSGRSAQLLKIGDISDNKLSYKQYKTSISTLLLGSRHDAVSGWMFLASFFYKTKQYKTADDILQYCLLKCTPEKLYQSSKLSHIQKELLKLHLFRKMTIVQLFKFLLIGNPGFALDCLLIPDELRIKGESLIRIMVPVVYAHFLRFLCHFHLHNTRKCRDCLRDLQLAIAENYFIGNFYEQATSYNMIGISFQLIGDTESARHAFMQSKELYPVSFIG